VTRSDGWPGGPSAGAGAADADADADDDDADADDLAGAAAAGLAGAALDEEEEEEDEEDEAPLAAELRRGGIVARRESCISSLGMLLGPFFLACYVKSGPAGAHARKPDRLCAIEAGGEVARSLAQIEEL